jgi:plastocyanin
MFSARSRLGVLAVLLGVGSAVLAGCGDDDGGSDKSVDCKAGKGGAALEVASSEYEFNPGEMSAKAGDIEVTMTNNGAIPHTFVIDGCDKDTFKVAVTSNGDTDTGSVNLPAGTYTVYCDIAGHRANGMEATLTVS